MDDRPVDSLPVSQCEAIEHNARFIVVGGGAQNIFDRVGRRLPKMTSVCINTNEQHLSSSCADMRILVGKDVTYGQDCQYPEVGAHCVERSRDEIESVIEGADFVYILTGLGGGTGSGISPYIAAMCKEKGIPSFGVAVMPLAAEGKERAQVAKMALDEMRRHTLLTVAIENDSVAKVSKDMGMLQWVELTDEAVLKLVGSIHEHVSKPYQHIIDQAIESAEGCDDETMEIEFHRDIGEAGGPRNRESA
jgi:cell division protein FtsZ